MTELSYKYFEPEAMIAMDAHEEYCHRLMLDFSSSGKLWHVHAKQVEHYICQTLKKGEYLFGNDNQILSGHFFFKTKEAAMRIKLGWQPEELIQISSAAW